MPPVDHGVAEETIQPVQMQISIELVRNQYGEVFGPERLAQATNPEHRAIAEQEERENEKKQNKEKEKDKK